MIDNIQPLTIIATGSSSFDLANKTGSLLTGQSVLFHLFPFSQSEISQLETPLQTQQNLEERLIFGNYPELFKLPTIQEKTEYLNVVIHDFTLPALRKDIGQLWENYILSERIKMNSYNQRNTQYFFWRNYTQQEIDLIENYNGKITSYEFKYPKDKKVKIPSAFSTAYPGAPFEVVTKDNYLEWIKA